MPEGFISSLQKEVARRKGAIEDSSFIAPGQALEDNVAFEGAKKLGFSPEAQAAVAALEDAISQTTFNSRAIGDKIIQSDFARENPNAGAATAAIANALAGGLLLTMPAKVVNPLLKGLGVTAKAVGKGAKAAATAPLKIRNLRTAPKIEPPTIQPAGGVLEGGSPAGRFGHVAKALETQKPKISGGGDTQFLDISLSGGPPKIPPAAEAKASTLFSETAAAQKGSEVAVDIPEKVKAATRLAGYAEHFTKSSAGNIKLPAKYLAIPGFIAAAVANLKNPESILSNLASKHVEDIAPAVYAARAHGMKIPRKGLSETAKSVLKEISRTKKVDATHPGIAVDMQANKALDDLFLQDIEKPLQLPKSIQEQEAEALKATQEKLSKAMHGRVYKTEANAERYAGSKLKALNIEYEIKPTAGGVKVVVDKNPNVHGTINAEKITKAQNVVQKVIEKKQVGKTKTPKIVEAKPAVHEARQRLLLRGRFAGMAEKDRDFLIGLAKNYDKTEAEIKALTKIKNERALRPEENTALYTAMKAHDTVAKAIAKRLNAKPEIAAQEILRQAEKGYIDPHLLLGFLSAFGGGTIGGIVSGSEGEFSLEGALVGAVLGAAAPALFKAVMRPKIAPNVVVRTPEGTGTVVSGNPKAWRVRMAEKVDGKDVYKNFRSESLFPENAPVGPISNRSNFVANAEMDEMDKLMQRVEETMPTTSDLNAKTRALLHRLHKWGTENLRGRDYKLTGLPIVRELVGQFGVRKKAGVKFAKNHNLHLIKLIGPEHLRDGTFSRYLQMKDMIASTKRGQKIFDNSGNPLDVEDLERWLQKFEANMGKETMQKFKAAEELQRDAYRLMFQHRVDAGIAKPEDFLEDYYPRFIERLGDKKMSVTPTGRQLKGKKGSKRLGRKQSTFEFDRGDIHVPWYENDVLIANEMYMTRHFADIAKIRLFRDLLENPNFVQVVRRNPDGTWPKGIETIAGKEAVPWTGSSLMKALHVDSLIMPESGAEKMLLKNFNVDEGSKFRVYMRRDLAEGLEDHFSYSIPTPVGRAARTMTRLWKEGVLHPAVVGIGYDLTNLLGDAERLALFVPEAFGKVGDALKIARYIKNEKLDVEDFVNQAIGPLKPSDLPDLTKGPLTDKKMRELARYMRENGIAGGGYHEVELAAHKGGNNIDFARSYRRGTERAKAVTDVLLGRDFIAKYRGIREDVLRIAATLKLIEYAQKNPAKLQKVIDRLAPVSRKAKYDKEGNLIRPAGRARKEYEDYIKGLQDAGRQDLLIAKLSREAMVDYGDFSRFEQDYLRSLLIPFWAFMKANAVGLTRMAVNDPKQFGLIGSGVYGMSHLWNSLMFPDVENNLKPWQQAKPHIILPRPIRTEGSSPYVAVGYNSILQDFFENLLMYNGMHTIDSAIQGDGVEEFDKHARQAFGRALSKIDFSLNPMLSIPRLLAPITSTISYGNVPTQKQWEDFANAFALHVLPGGRVLSRMVSDEPMDMSMYDFLYQRTGLQRFADSPQL